MPGFTIASILGNNHSSTIGNSLKRKNSDDTDEHQSNKRQTIERKTDYFFLLRNYFNYFYTHTNIQYIIKLNQ